MSVARIVGAPAGPVCPRFSSSRATSATTASSIGLGQFHCSTAGHLTCEGFQVVRLSAEERRSLQPIDVFLSLFLQTDSLGKDVDLGWGDFEVRFEQRRDF